MNPIVSSFTVITAVLPMVLVTVGVAHAAMTRRARIDTIVADQPFASVATLNAVPALIGTKGIDTTKADQDDSGRSLSAANEAQPVPLAAAEAALLFLQWWLRHADDLPEEVDSDTLDYIARHDFAEANSFVLPPRVAFARELRRLPGVDVQENRRVYSRGPAKRVRKATFYRISLPSQSPADCTLASDAPTPMRLAA